MFLPTVIVNKVPESTVRNPFRGDSLDQIPIRIVLAELIMPVLERTVPALLVYQRVNTTLFGI